MSVMLEVFGYTRKGHERQRNEDQFLVADLRKVLHIEQGTILPDQGEWLWGAAKRYVFAVADGVGANAKGEVASQLAVDTMARYMLNTMPWFYRLRSEDGDDLCAELATAMERANAVVEEVADEARIKRRPASTLSLAYLIWPRLYIVHAGHSRVHVLRDGVLHHVTTDHTVAQRLHDEGAISEIEKRQSPMRHVLWNSLGGEDGLYTELDKVLLEPDDRLVLSTDGVGRYLDVKEMTGILLAHPRPEFAARTLVDRVMEKGGGDDATVVVCRFRGD